MKTEKNLAVDKLGNGLTLVQVPMPGVASVAVVALVRVGSRYETEENMGLAHFYEHLSVMGTKKYPTNFEFTKMIEGVGADFNAFTGEEYTGFYIKTEGRQLPMALEMLGQLVIHPLLARSEIERERLVIMEEINMREDTPQVKVGDRMQELLFAGSGLGLPGAGTKKSVKRFKRKDFLRLKEDFYRANNMVLIVCGNIKGQRTELGRSVREYFGEMKNGEVRSMKEYEAQAGYPKIEVIRKQTDQVHLAMGFRGYSRKDKQRYAQALLSVILGSGFTSRLFQKVRQERSLAYYVDCDSELFVDTGMVEVRAGVDKQRVEEAVRVIWKELNKIQDAHQKSGQARFEIQEEELRKAKDYLRGKMVLRLEDPLNLGMYYGGQQLLEGKILTWDQVKEKVEAVTVGEVIDVAREIFDLEKMSLVMVSPKNGVEESMVNEWIAV